MTEAVIAASRDGLPHHVVAARNERTLAELTATYHAATGVPLCLHAVRRACQRLDLRRKGARPCPAGA